MIGIIDCGGANMKSLTYALERIKLKYRISKVWSDLSNSRALILPGVSAAGNVMSNIRKLALEDRIRDFNKPVLGICVGMQVLYEHSDEENKTCLGLIPGVVKKFSNPKLAIPHMGWNMVNFLTSEFEDCSGHFYFANSYHAPIDTYSLGYSEYGERFSAFVKQNNFYGVQFHPEKSSKLGEKFLTKFFEMA